MMHQLAPRKQRPAAPTVRRLGVRRLLGVPQRRGPMLPVVGAVRLVDVVLVILVRLLLAYPGGFPDESAPLVVLAEELERGERLDGVALQPDDLGDGFERLAFGGGH